MNHLVISTCGTSLLTNLADDAGRRRLNDLANRQANELTEDERDFLQTKLTESRRCLASASLLEVRKLSAELNGLLAFSDESVNLTQSQHILVHTDTFEGEQVAELLEEWLRGKQVRTVSRHCATDLTMTDLDAFRAGINGLVTWSNETLPEYRVREFRIVFNLVGGFKALQGFMQTLGMFYADEILYIFEASAKLLRIPRLPIGIDAAAKTAICAAANVFRRLDRKGASLPKIECASLPETFLYHLGDDVELSPWGRLIWQQHKGDLYRAEILDPLSYLVDLNKVRQDAQTLSPDRRAIFNERIDDLSRYLDAQRSDCPKRLDFKRLKGNPCPPATDEFDLWADQNAYRAFGHFEGNRFVIDKIGPGLH